MKITFLGTNGWYDTETGNTTCILIETRKEFIILDAGNGIYKIDRHIQKKKPIYLFLSHLHLDHIIGLHTLVRFNFSQGISLYCPRGTRKHLTRIINRPYTVPFGRLKTKVKLHELNTAKLPSPVTEIRKLKHPVTCYGFKFILEDKIVSYCPDTGLCDDLYRLARGADIFITECSAKPGEKDKKWPHLDAKQAARVAKASGISKLVLVHFNPHLYPTLDERKKAVIQAKKIFRNTFAAIDNMEIEI